MAGYRQLFSRYVLPRWRMAAVLGCLLLATIGLQLANPLILRRFIDGAQRGDSLGTLTAIAGAFLAVAILAQVVSVVETYVAQDLGWLATNQLRVDLAVHCLRLDPPFHATHSPGELIERIDGDVLAVANFFSRFVIYILGNGLLVLGVLVLFWQVDWRTGAAMTALVGAALVAIHVLRDVATPHWRAVRQATAELMGFIEERLSGTEDIRSSGATAYVMRRLYERMRSRTRHAQRAGVIGYSLGWVLTLTFYGAMAIALGLGSYLYLRHEITIGTVYLLLAYAQMLDRPLEMLTRQFQDFQQAAAGVRRIQSLLGLRSVISDGRGDRLPDGPLSVELDDVSFAYDPGEPVLRHVSIRIEPGKVVGVLGRTGSGKTTLSRLIFRLYDPIRGDVRLGGVDVRDARVAELRARVGMVTQDIQLFHASVRDNLTLFDASIPDRRIEEVLDELGLRDWRRSLPQGLDTRISAGASGLSAGQAQLLAFARVFLENPGLIVLDEASSRLDPATERLLEQAVDRLLEGRTGIVIAHRLGTVRRADEILILEDGQIVEQGQRTDLERDAGSRFSGILRAGMEEVLV
jgi:ABC-type multidrug transport system fused ATPase/permease subunit